MGDFGRWGDRWGRGWFGGGRGWFWGGRDGWDRWEKRMYSAVCDECGVDCEIPFLPKNDKPVLCSECFSNAPKPKKPGDYKEELDMIIEKLDVIIKHLWIEAPEKKEKVKVKLPKEEVEFESEDNEEESFMTKKKAPKKTF